jgi:hypothetical protein
MNSRFMAAKINAQKRAFIVSTMATLESTG